MERCGAQYDLGTDLPSWRSINLKPPVFGRIFLFCFYFIFEDISDLDVECFCNAKGEFE
jgi:hypothetical protein